MNTVNVDEIIEFMDNNNLSNEEKIFITRLFDDYLANKEANVLESEINYINLKASFDRIEKYYNNEIFNDEINAMYANSISIILNQKYRALQSTMKYIDVRNHESILKALELITELECLLKFPITYPSELNNCLAKILKNKKKETLIKSKGDK